MKKLLGILAILCFAMPMILAIPSTSNSLSSKGVGFASLSTEEEYSGSQSGHLGALNPTTGNEGRIRIEFNDEFALNDITNISWMQYVKTGYAAHVDIRVDLDGDGDEDDALVFEYDKSDDACGDGIPGSIGYPEDTWINTFDNKGTGINDNSYGWLSSGNAGNCPGDLNYDVRTLASWKANYTNAKVIALEIEVDDWVIASETFIDDVMLNGELIEDFDNQNIQVEINEGVTLAITPLTLNFGNVEAGSVDNLGTNIVFNATGSNVDVNVEVINVTGFPFETGLKLNGNIPIGESANLPCAVINNVCTYTNVEWTTSLTVPIGTPAGLKSGTIVYLISGPSP